MKLNNFINENNSHRPNCNLCRESKLDVGSLTNYGAIIIYKVGDFKDGWFATLSPKTGGNPEQDFTIQLMPLAHLTHFSQISNYQDSDKNYGVAFAKVSNAMLKIMADDKFEPTINSKDLAISIGTYGKCTNWIEKKEHLHLKLFPFKGAIGQPYTVDSSFERKEVYEDELGEKFVKMKPINKIPIPQKRFNELAKKLVGLLK